MARATGQWVGAPRLTTGVACLFFLAFPSRSSPAPPLPVRPPLLVVTVVRTRLVNLESVYPRTVRLRCDRDQGEMGTDEHAIESNNLPVVFGAMMDTI